MSALSEQPPPRKGAKAGYYPDPLGSDRSRYWDGVSWTPTLGPAVEGDAAPNKPVPPPTKKCRHCGVESETFEGNCPNCGRSYARVSGPVLAGIAAACVLLILLIGGCAVLFSAVVDEIDEEGEITERQFESVAIGDSQAQVEDRFGDPEDRAEFEDSQGRYVCWLYHDEDEPFDEDASFEFCFANGVVISKSDL
jgi:hypothetical protein